MKILDQLLATLDFDAPVLRVHQGIFHTGVLTRHCGLAATLPKDALRQDRHGVQEAGSLLTKSSEQLARLSLSESLLEAAIGMATVNSLIEVDPDSCLELNAAELILQKGEGKTVAIVGHFPFIPRVREKAKELWVIEKNPGDGDHTESEADHLIPLAEVVAITGTSLTNHTLEHLLDLCRPGAYIIMLGDTVPLSPILFDFGVDALSGTRVTDPEIALQCVCQGANFRQIRGTRRLTMLKP